MRVIIPHTNPIVFDKPGTYRNWMDATLVEETPRFVQKFTYGDRIQWQIRWEKVRRNRTHNVKVYVTVNAGAKQTYASFSITGVSTQHVGSNMSSYVEVRQSAVDGTFANGLLTFTALADSMNISNVTLLNYGDCFYFTIAIDGNEYESNMLTYLNPTSQLLDDTKVIGYGNSYDCNDTVFNLMVKDYEVRIPARFHHPKECVEKSVFQADDMSFELVSASPYETIDLLIGQDRLGIPDWFAKNLNFILHCDHKTIDGIGYEVTTESEFTVQRTDTYNFAMYSINISRINDEWSDSFGSADVPFEVIPVNPIYGNVLHPLEGILQIETAEKSYVVPSDSTPNNMILIETLSIPIGSSSISYVFSKNLSSVAVPIVLEFRSAKTDRLLKTITLSNSPWNKGIGFGSVGDTFYVHEQVIIN